MRLPSLRLVGEQTRAVAVRFPLVVVAALAATGGAMWALDSGSSWSVEVRLLLVSGLGIPVLLAVALWFERWPQRAGHVIVAVAVVGLLAAVFFAWPRWTHEVAYRRYLQLSLAAHLVASFLPFARGGQLLGFWQYNKMLLLRFLTAQLFAHVLFVGLVIALVALDQLFGIDVPERLYVRLWATTGILFTTLYFLGGIPRDLDALDSDPSYPAPLKVLAQYILLPIVVVYLVILTAYLGKVLVTRAWPSGWIGYLVSSVSLLGILSLLLLFPVQHRRENRWVFTYGRLLYLALLPSLGMLLAAVGKRVDQYGVTENRYFLVVLAVWLAALCVFYLVTRSRDIRWIPITLGAVALITAFGPWSTYGVSRRDQLDRLEDLLSRNDLRGSGRTAEATTAVSFDDRREISAVLTYLLSTHGAHSVRHSMPDAWSALDPEPSSRSARFDEGRDLARVLMGELGLEYVERWQRTEEDAQVMVSFSTAPGTNTVEVEGYRYMIRVRGMAASAAATPSEFSVAYDAEQRAWTLHDRDHVLLATIPLQDVTAAVREAQSHDTQPRTQPVVVEPTEGLRWKLVVYFLHVDESGGDEKLANIDAQLLFSVD